MTDFDDRVGIMKDISKLIAWIVLFIFIAQAPLVVSATDTTDAVSKDTDFEVSNGRLLKYNGSARMVAVPAMVTEVTEEAFAGNTTMKYLQFKGDQVKTIAYNAFARCTALKSVSLPDSLVSLGNGAFRDCTALTDVYIGAGLEDWGVGPFAGCDKLSVLTLSGDNKYFSLDDKAGYDTLYNISKTKIYLVPAGIENFKDTYMMNSSVTDIAEYAFWHASFANIGFSGGLLKIPDYAFSSCSNLVNINLPLSIRNIGVQAFADCVNLETATIPASVTYIDDTAFDNCMKLSINAERGTRAEEFKAKFDKKKREWEQGREKLADIGAVPSSEPLSEEEQAIYDIMNPPDTSAGSTAGQSHIVAGNAFVFMDRYPEVIDGQPSAPVPEPAPETPAKKTVTPTGAVADYAYYLNRSMGSFMFPDDTTGIGEFAFARSNIVRARIPAHCKSIDYGAFYHCDYLRDVTIPQSVNYIAPKAFANSMWLNNWRDNETADDFLVVGNGILLAYKGHDRDVEIPDTVKRIGAEAFADNINISSVHIPDSVIEIGEGAFNNCRNLMGFTGAESVTKIADRAFAGCPLESQHLPASLSLVGLAAFDWSTTSVGDTGKLVILDSNSGFPSATHEATAEKYANAAYRTGALADTQFVVTPKRTKVAQLAGTILDPKNPGFKGFVLRYATGDSLEIIASTYTASEYEAVYKPAIIKVDDKSYNIKGYDSLNVFAPESSSPDIGEAATDHEKEESTGEAITVRTALRSSVIRGVQVTLPEGAVAAYKLDVYDLASDDTLSAAYKAMYDVALPELAKLVYFSLVNADTGVPVRRFGARSPIAVSVTLDPNEIPTDSDFVLYGTDRQGQLEKLEYTRTGQTVSFTTQNLGSVIICPVS